MMIDSKDKKGDAQKKNPDKDQYDWIEFVVKAGEKIGMNPIRIRWKLRGWQDKMKQRGGAVSGKAHAVTRAHKVCPQCHALNSIDEKKCASCGASLHSRPVEVSLRFLKHFNVGSSPETVLGLVLIFMYGLVAVKGQQSGWFNLNSQDLAYLGGNFPYAALKLNQWWRLWTSVLLHGGLWHIGFNVYALIYLVPFVKDVYGSNKMIFAFFVTGVSASFVSLFMQLIEGTNAVGIGASGALCGLIGLVIVWGHRDGSHIGLSVRNSMARWVVYILIFGFFIGADNSAHIGGLVAGGVLSLIVPPKDRKPESALWKILGSIGWIAVAFGAAIISYLAFTGYKF